MQTEIFIPRRIMGIIGHPLGHSLSPVLHNWAFRKAGLDAAYMAWPLPPERLADFITAVRTLPITGVSVTIPHKERIKDMVDEVTDRSALVGAVNTLFWGKDGRLVGDNTDLAGFLRPLKDMNARIESALVLGAGGAARAVLAGLKELGVTRIAITNRTLERAENLALDFDVDVVAWQERTRSEFQCLVNATPLGMAGQREDETPWPEAYFSPHMLAYDLVYNPGRTRFIREAEHAGCAVVPGMAMFTGQAAEQFRLWTGQDMDLTGAARVCAQALAGN